MECLDPDPDRDPNPNPDPDQVGPGGSLEWFMPALMAPTPEDSPATAEEQPYV